ncbi:MAG: DUF6089 family protein [Prevotellaceae bacterium]|jgi:hypothetical protein|nr:DUF6089 family protein [Prevotellaceae bacterium]
MKKIVLLIVAMAGLAIFTQAQVNRSKQSFFTPEKTDLGLGAGTTFYLGDFNEWFPFNNPRYYGTVFHRYSFNMLYSIRTSVTMGKVDGNSKNYSGELPYYDEHFPDYVIKFSRTFVDINMGMELGFRAFDPALHQLKQKWTPYLFLGLGLTILYPDTYRNETENRAAGASFPELYGSKEDNEGSSQIFTIPIAMGIKWTPWERWTLGVEWQFKKSFWDKIDRFDNTNGGSKLLNSDWISTFGVSIAYRLKTNKKCPALIPWESSKDFKKGINRFYNSYDNSGKKSRNKKK